MKKTDHHLNVTSVALTAPAVRMVVVEANAYREADDSEWKADHATHPVLAIQALAGHSYSRRFDERRPPPTSPDHAEMIGLGWRYAGGMCQTEYDVLIMDQEYGLCDASFAFGEMQNTAYCIVACPWPEAEDPERLARIIAEVRAEAIDRAAANARRAAESGTVIP